MRVVGHSVEAFLTIVRIAHGKFAVTQHTVTHELHPTKGWRLLKTAKRTINADRVPLPAERKALTFQTFKWTARAARREEANYGRPITESMLARHGWYRRKLRLVSAAVAS